ncbi:DUF3718 domain-containing protein [Neiella marina]|uniref:DUF3718 domain-containing protein n=1 Tax=Neiella holothuriorum TaxID=2870530 RepID=A0ABS7EFK4_9GAMM|nr:DUF3718 domain-containing protein [Neiella holothuriorum]MBW8191136.1 DUF3718 domain-containing protein [Neiella holothuriorum]
MKKLTITTLVGMVTTFVLLISAPSKASMNPVVEKALQDVCHTSLSNKTMNFKKVVKSYRLDLQDVADKVVCNGEDIGTFAAENGADEIANYIRSLQEGHVEIQELASL